MNRQARRIVFKKWLDLLCASGRKLFLDITEARNIDAVRAMPERNLIFVPRDKPGSSAAHAMIHQVVPKLVTGISKPLGKFRGRGVQQDPGRYQGRSAEKQNTSSEFQSLARLPVNHTHAGCFSSIRIKDNTVYYAVRADRNFPRGLRSRKRRIQTTEIRARDAAARARPAIMASSAPAMPLRQNRRATDRHHAFVWKAPRDRILSDHLGVRPLHSRYQ